MEHWIIPSNNQKFRIDAFLAKYENKVDWKQLTRISVGDVVYIYGTRPEMRIKYKMKVIAIDIPFKKSLYDKNCWNDELEYKKGIENNKYFRMQLVSLVNTDNLTMAKLHEYGGVKGNIQKARRALPETIAYIEESISNQ